MKIDKESTASESHSSQIKPEACEISGQFHYPDGSQKKFYVDLGLGADVASQCKDLDEKEQAVTSHIITIHTKK